MNLEPILHFLIDLKYNNNRNWFQNNQDRYKSTKSEFEKFIGILITKISAIDKSVNEPAIKDCMFRIFRDMRFSKNGEPYKYHYGASISEGGRKSIKAGYYIHFEPDASFIGGGIYAPLPINLKAIRNQIYNNPEEYKKIINEKKFRQYFPTIYGEKLKLSPKGFSKDFPDIDLLKNKHYAIIHKIDNSFWFEKNLIDNLIEIFKIQYKFNNFLNCAINDVT